jgi:hypothetical protein
MPMKLWIATLGALALLVAATRLLRSAPERGPLHLPPTSAGTPATPPAPDVAPTPAAEAPGEDFDSFGVPLDSKRAAREVEEMVRAYGAAKERLKQEIPNEEYAELSNWASHTASRVTFWCHALSERMEFGHRRYFEGLLRGSDHFKHEAAEYLARLPEGAGRGALREALEGTSLYARGAAAAGLAPWLDEHAGPLLPAFRKALTDDFSAVSDNTFYGSSEIPARELARKLRGVAVGALARAGDVESLPAFVDLLVGRDGVDWWPIDDKDGERYYALLAKELPKARPPLALERMEEMIDAHLAARGPLVAPPGDPTGAALLLDGLGRPGKLREMRDHYYAKLVERRDSLENASSLLGLLDTRGVDTLLDGLIDPNEHTRFRAAQFLNIHTKQRMSTGDELGGSGSAQDVARWAEIRRRWSDWWTRNRQTFEVNPYAK